MNVRKNLIYYYLLNAPAVLTGIAFTILLLTNKSSTIYSYAIPMLGLQLPTLIEIAVLSLIIYSLFKAKISILLTLIVISFFFFMVNYGETINQSTITIVEITIIVILSLFCSLASFNFSRSEKLLKGKEPITKSSGPFGYTLFNIVLDFAFPPFCILLIAFLTIVIVNTLKRDLSLIPGAISSIGPEYLSTSIGQATVALVVLGSVLWIIKQTIEPIILNYTLNSAQAEAMLFSEEDMLRKIKQAKELKVSGIRGWFILASGLLIALITTSLFFVGKSYLLRELNSIIFRKAQDTQLDRILYNGLDGISSELTRIVLQGENLVKIIFRILFG